MMITVHLVDGRKITKDMENLDFFSTRIVNGISGITLPCPKQGKIAVNVDNIIDFRPAEDDEIEHARIHGW